MPKRPWTDEQRAEALQLLATVGKAEAHRRTGIPLGTIACWGYRHKVTAADATIATRQAVEHRVATLAERKARLAEQLADAAERMLADATASTVERKVVPGTQWRETEIVDVEHATTTHAERRAAIDAVAKAVETVQLLTGEATERIEQIGGDAVKEAARAKLDELAQRREAKTS